MLGTASKKYAHPATVGIIIESPITKEARQQAKPGVVGEAVGTGVGYVTTRAFPSGSTEGSGVGSKVGFVGIGVGSGVGAPAIIVGTGVGSNVGGCGCGVGAPAEMLGAKVGTSVGS